MNGQQARWCLYLTPFDFVIKHRTGKSNPADGPSRQYDILKDKTSNAELLAPIQERFTKVSTLKLADFVRGKS
jgi:hypothetical protein